MKFLGLLIATAIWSTPLLASQCPSGDLACSLDYDLYCINEAQGLVLQESLLVSEPSHPLSSPKDSRKNPDFIRLSENELVIEAADFQTDNSIVKYTFKLIKEMKDGAVVLKGTLSAQNSEPSDLNCKLN